MKKIILLVALIYSINQNVFSQEKAFSFGFKVAPSIGWMKLNSDGYESNGVKGGFNWGFVGDIHLMENYSIQTGINILYLNGSYSYPYKEYKNGFLPTVGNLDRVIHLKYLQIPVVLRMKTEEFSKFTVYGEAGLGLAFRTAVKSDDVFTAVDGTIVSETDKGTITDEVRFTRESMILGAGVYYAVGGSTKLTAGLRFDNNFFDILKDQNTVDPSIEQKGISNFIELSIGLLF